MINERKKQALIGTIRTESEIFSASNKLADSLLGEANKLLSIWGMTTLQYNALRVLYVKDSKNKGLPSKEIGSRLYTRVPDVTRLLDRLAEKGWIIRERDSVNKRIVRSRLTDIGIELIESAHQPLMELEATQLTNLNEDEKIQLKELLNKALKTI